MSWFYLALLAPLLYAIVNLLDDNMLQFVYKSPYIAASIAGLFGILPLLSRFFIDAPGIPAHFALWSAIGGFMTLIGVFFYFKGLDSDMPSVVVALLNIGPAFIPVFAHFIVGERLIGWQILGFTIVLLGSLGLAATDLKKFKFSPALAPMIAAVVLINSGSVVGKYVYEAVPFYPAYLYFSIGMGLGGVALFLFKFKQNKVAIREIAKHIKRLLPFLIISECTALAAEFTLNLAISRGPVSLVKAIESVQPVYVLLIALLLYPIAPKFFREAEAGKVRGRALFMIITIAGLVLISLNQQA